MKKYLLIPICLVQSLNMTFAASSGVTPISELPAKSTPIAGSNLLVIVDTPGIVGGTKKITVQNFFNGLTNPPLGGVAYSVVTNLISNARSVGGTNTTSTTNAGGVITINSLTDTNMVKSFSSIDSFITTNSTMAQIQAAFDNAGNIWVQRGRYTIGTNLYIQNPTRGTHIYMNGAIWSAAPNLTGAMIDTGVGVMQNLPLIIQDGEFNGTNIAIFAANAFFSLSSGSPVLLFNPHWANRTGMKIDSACGGMIYNCKFYGWDGQGILMVNSFTNIAYQYPRVVLFANDIRSNFCGITLASGPWEVAGYYNNPQGSWPSGYGGWTNAMAEYQPVIANNIAGNYVGISGGAGNAQIQMNSVNNNFIGMFNGSGINAGHGIYANNNFNHTVADVPYGVPIWVESNNGGSYVNNQILASATVIFNGVTGIMFDNNRLGNTAMFLIFTNACKGRITQNLYQGNWGSDVSTNFTGTTNGVIVQCNFSENGSSDGSQCSQVYSNTFTAIGGTGIAAFTDTLFVRTNGNNATAVKGDPGKPWLSISNAVAASSAGDVIDVGSGVFDTGHGLTLKTGTTLQGGGWDTILSNSVTTVAADGCIVNLASGCLVKNLWIWGTDDAQLQPPIGIYSDATIPGAAFTNAVIMNVRTRADSDAVYVYHTNACSLFAYNCLFEAKWDSLALGGNASSHLEFWNCAFRSIWPSLSSAQNISRVANLYQGEVKFVNCELIATNGPTTTTGIGVYHTAAIVDLIDSYIFTGSTNGSILDIDNSTNGTVRVSGVGVDQAKTAGNITWPVSIVSGQFMGIGQNTNKPLQVLRMPASMNTNISEWQNTSSNILATVNNAGSFGVQALSATGLVTALGNMSVSGTLDVTNTLTARGSAAVSGQLQVTNAVTAQTSLIVGTNGLIHSTNVFQVAVPSGTAGQIRAALEVGTNDNTYITGSLNIQGSPAGTLKLFDSSGNGPAAQLGTNDNLFLSNSVSHWTVLATNGTMTLTQTAYSTNQSTMAPNFTLGYSFISTNAAFTFLAPTGIDTAKLTVQSTVVYVTNSTAAVVVITPPANCHPVGTANVTNLTRCTFECYPNLVTNVFFVQIF